MTDPNVPAAYNNDDLTQINVELIDAAFKKIKSIYHDKTHETAYSIGECLLEYFYKNDIDRVRNNNPIDDHSLNQLVLDCKNEMPVLSKSWLYASLNLLVDRVEMVDCTEYRKLSLSHKFNLLKVHNVSDKLALAKVFFDEGLSVRQAIQKRNVYLLEKQAQGEDSSGESIRRKSLISLIKNPQLISMSEFKEITSVESINNLKTEKREKLSIAVEEKLRAVEAEVEKQKAYKRHLESLLKKLKPIDIA